MTVDDRGTRLHAAVAFARVLVVGQDAAAGEVVEGAGDQGVEIAPTHHADAAIAGEVAVLLHRDHRAQRLIAETVAFVDGLATSPVDAHDSAAVGGDPGVFAGFGQDAADLAERQFFAAVPGAGGGAIRGDARQHRRPADPQCPVGTEREAAHQLVAPFGGERWR